MTPNQWTVAGPVARLTFVGDNVEAFTSELTRIAGVKNKGYWQIPFNALPVVNELMGRFPDVQIGAATWEKPPAKKMEWAEVEAALREDGTLQEWVYAFYTQYQKEAIAFGFNKDGCHFWHPTGCVSADTELVLNRAGKGFRTTIEKAYYSFNGDRPSGRGKFWDLSIPTQAQCEIDGVLRLNEVVDIVKSGIKVTYTVKAGDMSVRTTMDHRFYTPEGFKKLSELLVGDEVIVRGSQKADFTKKKPIYKICTVKNHPYANSVTYTLSPHKCKTHRYKLGHQVTEYRVPEHRLVAEAVINGITVEELKKRCRQNDLTGLTFLDPKVHAVHHKNRDPRDNRPENLEVLKHDEHKQHHADEHTTDNVLYKTKAVRIDSITRYGEEMTYDVCMKNPHNNFTANGFVVHNSGKTLSGVSTALSVPGPIVVVTRAASRIQYSREINRFTNTKSYIVRPVSDLGTKVTVKGKSFKQFCGELRFMGVKKGFRKLWESHIEEHGPDPLPTVQHYVDEMKTKGLRPFIVVGWESLPENLDALIAIQPGCVVYDELHRGKGTKRFEVISLIDLPEDPEEASKMLRKDANDARAKGGFIKATDEGRKMFVPVKNVASSAAMLARAAKKRLGTTATSVSNRVKDLWGQLDTIEPNAWGNATSWQDRYCDRHPGTYGGFDISGESNKEELKKRLDTVVHFLDYRETHKHLPPKRRQSYYVSPADQVAESGGFANALKEAYKRGPSSVLEMKLMMAASRKRKAVLGLVEDHVQSGHKIVLFTGRRRDCDELGEMIRKDQKNLTVWSAHGEHSDKLRQTIVDDYMSHPGPCVLVSTGQALGESINLHDTDAAMFVQLPYTPGQLRQWEGRFARLSQKRPVVIYYVIAEGTVDERVASILIDKLPAVETVGKDSELAEAAPILAGIDPNRTPEEFAQSILANIDERGLAEDDWSDWD